jgi:hypothetical protein
MSQDGSLAFKVSSVSDSSSASDCLSVANYKIGLSPARHMKKANPSRFHLQQAAPQRDALADCDGLPEFGQKLRNMGDDSLSMSSGPCPAPTVRITETQQNRGVLQIRAPSLKGELQGPAVQAGTASDHVC